MTSGTASFTSDGYNLTDDKTGAACGFTNSTDIVDANPQLGPLEPNGGLTKTMLPALASPAVDKIPPAATFNGVPRRAANEESDFVDISPCGNDARDQRGRPRPLPWAITIKCTIGAVETGRLSADMRISKSGPRTVTQGGTVTYTLRLVNHGPGVAEDVAVTDPMSRDLTGISVSPSSRCAVTGARRVRCEFGPMAAGSGRTVTIRARVAPRARPGSVIENCATVSTVTPQTGSGSRISCVRTRTREVEVPVTG